MQQLGGLSVILHVERVNNVNTLVCLYLNRKYDVCSFISQSEDLNPGVSSVKTAFVKVYKRACHED